MSPKATTRLHSTIFITIRIPSLERRSARRVLGRDRLHQLNRGGAQDHHEECGKDQEDERERELDARLPRHLLRPLTALVRIDSACARSDCAMLVPRRSAWIIMAVKA